jgi:hypothetical protein
MRFEIIMLLLATACGDVSSGRAGGDAGSDGSAGADAALPGPVRVTVLGDVEREPLEDIDVAFFGPDGAHEVTVQTDASGVATADLMAGGAVMAFPPTTVIKAGLPPSLTAWVVLDVHPGDEIVLGGQRARGDFLFTMTLTLPVQDAATPYTVSTPCGTFGSESNVVPIAFYENCATETFPFVAVATTGETRHFMVSADEVTVAEAGDAPIEQAWIEAQNEEIDLTDVPPNVGLLRGTLQYGRLDGDELFVAMPQSSVDADTSAGTISPLRTEGFDELMLGLEIYNETDTLGRQLVSRWSDGGEDTPAMSIEDVLLPWVGYPYYDSATRTFAWPQVGDGDWDSTTINLYWYANGGKKVPSTSGQLIIIAPPGIHQAVLPPLPDDLAQYLPEEVSAVDVSVQLFESAGVDGWDAARQLGIDTNHDGFARDESAAGLTRRSFSAQLFAD